MTINTREAQNQPLLTRDDMIARIGALLAPAERPDQLWLLLLDGSRCQSPVLIPLDGCPRLPDTETLQRLAEVADAIIAETLDGHGSVIFVLERPGAGMVGSDERCWAAGLLGACERAGVAVAGTFLLGTDRTIAIEMQ